MELRDFRGRFVKGSKMPKDYIERRIKSREGYRHSEDTKRKIRKTNSGKCYSPQTCFKKGHKTLKGIEKGQFKKGQNIGHIPYGGFETRFKNGILHPNWKNGSSFEPYGLEFNKKLREEIRKRDNHICQRCGIKENGEKLAVHHIDFNKKNSVPENLISLCNSCHSFITTNKIIKSN